MGPIAVMNEMRLHLNDKIPASMFHIEIWLTELEEFFKIHKMDCLKIHKTSDESFEQFAQYCTLRDKEEYEHNGLSLCYAIHGSKINGCDTNNCPRLKAKERTSCAPRQESVNIAQQTQGKTAKAAEGIEEAASPC